MKYRKIILALIFIISVFFAGCRDNTLNLDDIITLESAETQTVLVSEESSQKESKYVLNTSSKKIHRSDCRYADSIKPENYAATDDYEKALSEGYTPCGTCKPT